MTPHRGWLLALLLAALGFSGASADTRVFVRFKLLEPTGTSYYVQLGGFIHVEPWTLPGAVWPAGADNDRAKRVGSGAFTDWFDLGKYAGPKLHGQLYRAGGMAAFPKHASPRELDPAFGEPACVADVFDAIRRHPRIGPRRRGQRGGRG